jgi:hypothetical protein
MASPKGGDVFGDEKQRDKFYEPRKSGDPVEAQLNCAEAILAGKVKESAPVTKHNGVTDNGTLFRWSIVPEKSQWFWGLL